MQHIVTSVSALVPVFIFAVLLRQFWSGEAADLLRVWKPVTLALMAMFAVSLALWLTSAMRLKCTPGKLLKKVWPPFFIAFSTASSMAAMTLSMETCEKKLGAKGSMVSFAFPLGSVIYMPGAIVNFAVFACSFAEIYQIEVSLPWIITVIVIVSLLTIAMPPIPGAGVLVYTVLFSSLGIPASAMALAATAELVIEFFATGVNVALLILQIACEAERFGELDRGVLTS